MDFSVFFRGQCNTGWTTEDGRVDGLTPYIH